MNNIIPRVHLFVCLDERVSPGVVLQLLDLSRVQDWQEELILICDKSWKPFVNVDQPVIFLDKEKFFSGNNNDAISTNTTYMDDLLDQLDLFEIQKVTQIGGLSWGRWLKVYLEGEKLSTYSVIDWMQKKISSLQVLNDVADELAIDLCFTQGSLRSNDVLIDPYTNKEINTEFKRLISNINAKYWPDWLYIISKHGDESFLTSIGLEAQIVSEEDVSTYHTNQSVLCFSQDSPFVQASRNYNVALYNCNGRDQFFVPGDISIQTTETDHLSEIINILSYWKTNRLRELSFQWLNMGIEIYHLETFHSRVVQKNLLNYSLDLFHSQSLIKSFLQSNGRVSQLDLQQLVEQMRLEIDNDPYSLSFSLKILNMIVDRMLASAETGERLFHRLGSDFQRIIIGESLIEGLIHNYENRLSEINVKAKLINFKQFLLLVDQCNDNVEQLEQVKDPQ